MFKAFQRLFKRYEKGIIFWDHENMSIPRGLRGYEAVKKLNQLALKQNTQLISINAIGNTNILTSDLRGELEAAGVVLHHVSSQKDSAADIAIHLEIMKLIQVQPPPFTIYLISSDTDYSKLLNFLTGLHYKVVLIHKDHHISDILLNSANHRVSWSDIVNIPGRQHIN